MTEVVIHDDEDFERALKRFRKQCEKVGFHCDLPRHRHYEKPSEKRKRQHSAAQRESRGGYHRAPRA